MINCMLIVKAIKILWQLNKQKNIIEMIQISDQICRYNETNLKFQAEIGIDLYILTTGTKCLLQLKNQMKPN